jgi:cytochrome c5
LLSPALVLLMLLGAGCSEKETTSTQEAAPAPAPQTAQPEAAPAAETAAPAAAESQAADEPAAAVDGQKVYQAACQACHAAGVAGAPKLGDKEAWAPRIAKGEDVLLASVNNGLNAMPPKGACMSCSEDDLRAAVEYMVEQGS